MASKIKCPHCSVSLKLPDGFSRNQAKCPQCKKAIPIPPEASLTSPAYPPPLPNTKQIEYEAGKNRRQKFRLGFRLLFLLLIPFSIYVLYNSMSGNPVTVFRQNPGFSVMVYSGETEGSAYVITNRENEPLQVNGVKLNGEYDCQLGEIGFIEGLRESQLDWPVTLQIGETTFGVKKPSYLSCMKNSQDGIAWKEYKRSVIYIDVFTNRGEFHFDGRGQIKKTSEFFLSSIRWVAQPDLSVGSLERQDELTMSFLFKRSWDSPKV